MKKVKRWIKLNIVPFLSFLIIAIISKTLRMRTVNRGVLERVQRDGGRIITGMWHREHFLVLWFHRDIRVAIMTSMSEDGELLSRILRLLGYHVVRGSSSKGGERGLVQMMKLVKEGYGAFFAVDGPRGPIYEVKPGIIYLAKKLGFSIIPVSAMAKRKIVFNSWDKFILPFPFTRAVIVFGEPFYIKGSIEEGKSELKKRLNELGLIAEKYLS